MDVARTLEEQSVFYVGYVSAVRGRQVAIAVDTQKNSTHLLYRGKLVRNVGVGSYVKVAKGFSELVGKIDGEEIRDDRPQPGYARPGDAVRRILNVSLIGFIEDGSFRRGVRELPLVHNECFVLTEAELAVVHALPKSSDDGLDIGCLAMEPTQRVRIGVNAYFGSHMGIFGNTGSGKSYTLTKLYHELFRHHASDPGFAQAARFVIIDFNGEYVDVADPQAAHSTAVITDAANKTTYQLSTRRSDGPRLPISHAALHEPTFWTVLLDATERTQAPFIRRALASTYWDSVLSDNTSLLRAVADIAWRATRTSDPRIDRQEVANLLREIQACLGDPSSTPGLSAAIRDFETKLQFHSGQNKYYWEDPPAAIIYGDSPAWESTIKNKIKGLQLDFSQLDPINRIRLRLVLHYYSDIVYGHGNREHLSPLIKRLTTRVGDVRKLVTEDDAGFAATPLTIISLRDVNLDMRKVIPMLVCKQLYDDHKMMNSPDRYLNLIIDEAHNILSSQSARESDAWRDYRLETFEEIIKEGRKFNVFLTIASQRPHDISDTIISQLHNYFLHRLINEMDIRSIERAVAYLDSVSFESLPILATGTCVMAGIAAELPLMVDIAPLPPEAEPNSRTRPLTKMWATATGGEGVNAAPTPDGPRSEPDGTIEEACL